MYKRQVQVQLKGTQGTITLSPAPKTNQWGDIGIRVEQEMCIRDRSATASRNEKPKALKSWTLM